MSFAGEVRDELYEGVPKKSCCRRALAAGLLLGAETEDKTVTVRFPSEACADYAEEVFRTQFGRGLTFARRLRYHSQNRSRRRCPDWRVGGRSVGGSGVIPFIRCNGLRPLQGRKPKGAPRIPTLLPPLN